LPCSFARAIACSILIIIRFLIYKFRRSKSNDNKTYLPRKN
jgi:hypothetical protein